MGFPPTGTSGLGTVNVCGLRRLPLPAIGTITFISSYFTPVLPNPPAPRAESVSSVTSVNVTF